MANESSEARRARFIAEARAASAALERLLPRKIDVQELGVWSKGPYLALVLRGALGFRSEEVIRCGCKALESGDRGAAAILARSAMENLVFIRHLSELLRRRAEYGSAGLHQRLHQLLMGSRESDLPADWPKAVNILTFLGKFEAEFPGAARLYERLSEVAHPNYGGVHGLYAKVDYERFVTHFGREMRGDGTADLAALALVTSAELFLVYFNRVLQAVDEWLLTLSPLSGPRDRD